MATPSAAAQQAERTAEGLVAFVPLRAEPMLMDVTVGPSSASAGWLGLLAAGGDPDATFAILLGKVDRPRVDVDDPIVVMAGGVVRCRLPLLKLENGVPGWSLVLSGAAIARATGVMVPRAEMVRRWSDTTGLPMPRELWFPGWRNAWWKVGDEQPFPTWATAGLAPDVAEAARALVASFSTKTRAKPAAPVTNPVPVAKPPTPAPTPSPTATAAPTTPAATPSPQRSLF